MDSNHKVQPPQTSDTSNASPQPVVPSFHRSRPPHEPKSISATTHKSDDRGFRAAILSLAIFALILSGTAATFSVISFIGQINNANSSNSATVDSSQYYTGNNTVQFEETTIASVADKVTPAVVSILTETQTQNYFFGQSQTTTGAGTGMIVTEDGYIITNSHVVSDADRVTVVTDNGDTYENVEVVGVDPLNDVAYLKIANVSDLPTVVLGDSKSIATGQPVLAIGNALGVYQNSITQGIISGTGRTVTATDSSGNPGNSGGPLVNAAGEVIGINTAVSTSAQGLGFAIPISSVKGMLENIIENGLAERAYLGVTYIAITPDVAKEYDLPVSTGAYVYGSTNPVVTGGPADRAGVKKGDIITKVNGIEIGSAGSILTLIGEYPVGKTIQLTIIRDGIEHNLDVELAAYPG